MRSLVVGAAFLASASGTLAQEMQVISVPEVGAEATIPAGGEVYSYARVYTLDGAVLEQDAQVGLLFTKERVPKGTQLIPVASKSKFKACVPYANTFTASGPCYLDDDGDGLFDRNSQDEGSIAIKSRPPTPYNRVKITIIREDSFKRSILYQGASADAIRFSYREFKNDIARPAFTEELTIPREQLPAMIMVKNIQMEVKTVSGMGLTYRIVRVH